MIIQVLVADNKQQQKWRGDAIVQMVLFGQTVCVPQLNSPVVAVVC